jgi:hypothetical protein
MLEYQDEVARRTEKAQRDLAESRGADTNQLLKMDKEASKSQEERDAKRLANLRKSIANEKKIRSKAYSDDDDEAKNASQQKIDTYQKEIDALELNFKVLGNMGNKYQIDRQVIDNKIVQNSKKAAEKRTKDNKKELDKMKDDHEKFVFDIDKLNELMIEQDIALGETILSTWEDTYDKKLYNVLLSQEKEISAVSKLYDDFYTSQQEKFLKSAEWVKIEAEKKKNKIVITPEIKDTEFKKWIASQPAIAAKLVEAQINVEEQRTAIIDKYSKIRTQLIEDEVKANAKMYKESARAVLTTDEFLRYADFIKLNGENVRKEALTNVKMGIYELQGQLARLKDIKPIDAETTKDVAKAIEITTKNIAELTKRQKELAELDPEKTRVIQEQIDYQNQLLKEKQAATEVDYEDVELTKARIKELENEKEAIEKKRKAEKGSKEQLDEYIDLLNKAGIEYENIMEIADTTSEVSKSGVATLTTWHHQIGQIMIDTMQKDIDALSWAVDEGITGIYNWQDKSTEAIENVFDLQRELTKDNIGESIASNKLLVSIYQDKFNGIVTEETNINAQLPALLDERIKIYSTAQKDETAQMKEAREARLAELKKLQGREFQVTPRAGKNDIGLEELTKNIPQLTQQMTTALEDRYKSLSSLEQRYYDQQLYDLFKQRDAGLITEDEYNKKLEELKKNHEENILAIDVVYGKKGQEEFIKLQQERKDLVKAEHQKEKERKMKNLQELLDLEKMTRQLYMQYLEQSYAKEDRLSQQRYDDRISAIDDEEKAYEDSIANRTAAEQQQIDIKEEFDLQREEAEKQRRMEQNAIAKQAFDAEKINSLAEIAIQYAVAIAKDWGTLGPFGAPMAAYHLIEAGLAAALVASQEFVPQFATGGLVVGPGGPKDDMINAKLSNGEAVINAKSTSMYAPILSAINEAGGGVPIPNVNKQSPMKMAFADGGVALSNRNNTPMIMGNSGPVVVGLDGQTMSELEQIMMNANSNVSISENTITNSQEKVAKVERRTKF